MPRTKRPVKKTEKASESGEASEFLKKLDKVGMFTDYPTFPSRFKLIQLKSRRFYGRILYVIWDHI